jgi:hypothetical protein
MNLFSSHFKLASFYWMCITCLKYQIYRRNREDLSLVSIILNQEIRRLATQVSMQYWSLFCQYLFLPINAYWKFWSFPNLLEWLTWCDYYFLNSIRKLDLIHWVAPMELHINSNWLLPMIKYVSPSRSIVSHPLLTLTSSIYENILSYIFSRMRFACISLRGGQCPKHTYTFLFEKSYIMKVFS